MPALRYRLAADVAYPAWFSAPIELTLAYGQSRADDRAEGTDICLAETETALIPDRVLMLNNNGAPGRTFESDFIGPEATALIPFQDGRGVLGTSNQQLCPLGQSLGSSLWWLDQDDVTLGRPSRRRLYVAAGEGGRKIAELLPGAAAFVGQNATYVIYARFLRKVARAAALAAVLGRPLIVRTILMLQGEADADHGVDTPKATYKASRAALYAALRADIPAITGQAEPIDIISDIVAGTPTNGSAGYGSGVMIAQVEEAVENADGRTFGIGPVYWLPFASAEHMTKQGVVLEGEMFGRAMSIRRDGGTPDFCRATGASIAGNVITVHCHAPVGPLVIDTTTTIAATGTSAAGAQLVKGFEIQSGNGVTITDVTVSGSDIIIPLSAAPTAPRLLHAMNGLGNTAYTDPVTGRSDVQTPGSWGNIRDSLAVPSRLVPGAHLRNFLAPFDISTFN